VDHAYSARGRAGRRAAAGLRVRRSALSQWLRRLEEDTTAEEQGADGQLRRQVRYGGVLARI
jgi:hypothetical protein